MQKLNFTITIHASATRVWETLTNDSSYREWAREFNAAGGWYEGSWEKGSTMRFLGPDPNTGKVGGMLSEIAENRKPEFVSIRHIGYVLDGKDITDTPEVRVWAPAYENYTLTEAAGVTTLNIYLESEDQYAEMFNEMWPRALQKIKQIAEQGA